MCSGKIMIQDPIIDTSAVEEGHGAHLYLVLQKTLKANSPVSRSKDYHGPGKRNNFDHSSSLKEKEPKLTKISKTFVHHLRHFKSSACSHIRPSGNISRDSFIKFISSKSNFHFKSRFLLQQNKISGSPYY